MSKGSTIVHVRVPDELLGQLDEVVASYRRAEPWTRSSFLIYCLREQIKKRERSRTWKPRGKRRYLDVQEALGKMPRPPEAEAGTDKPAEE